MNNYDVIIIGAGPAGLSAGLYASRAKLNTLLLEKGIVGGQITKTTEIENYPGSDEGITADDLVLKMKEQCLSFGAKISMEEVISVTKDKDIFQIKTNKNEYSAKSCIIASGSIPRPLGIKGEKEYTGMGVSYCATCDGGFFTGLDVVVVGGGDTALKEGIFLTKFAKKVSIIHRRDKFRGARILEDRAKNNDKIEFILNSEVIEIKGEDGLVNAVTIKNNKTNEVYDYKTDGVFMFVGNNPTSNMFKDLVELDEKGYIITNENLETNVKGLFVAGDVRRKNLRQVVTAASDGAICAVGSEEYIESLS